MIIVTGASRGIGRVVCERLTQKHIPVLGIARNTDDLPFDAWHCDVGAYDEVKELAVRLKRKNVEVTGLINAAGVASMNLALTTPPSTTEKIVRTNLLGTMFCCQLLAPLIIRAKGGSIINFSTIAVALGLAGESVYVASKAGVEGFSRTLARELADFGIRVNCIAPGPIATDLLRGVSDEQISGIVAQQIVRRSFTVDDVADVVEVLLDPKCSSLTGQVLHVGGV